VISAAPPRAAADSLMNCRRETFAVIAASSC
jgi:hypothetical protein